MRNLRFYENDADFKTHEQEAGGTGIDVESVVPGIVKTLDERKMYFNPHDKGIQFHTLTINYKNRAGENLASSTTKSIKYIPGVEQEIVVTPKNIDGYVPKEDKKTVTIPNDSIVDFIYSTPVDPSQPLTFKILCGGTIYWCLNTGSVTKTIQYKKNDSAWVNITSTTGGTSIIVVNAGDTVQFRGDNATYGTSDYFNYFTTSPNTKFEVEGNIMSLIDSTGFTTATTLSSSYTFHYLFPNCTGLTSAENLALPATTLTNSCYSRMFHGCTSLVAAPYSIGTSSTTMAISACSNMFNGCYALTTAPELPATTLAASCYTSMFSYCTSLTTAPELPATTLASSCYRQMFYNCTSLAVAPELPATTLAESCYYYMFYGCTSLATAPALPATTLADSCYYSMFSNCTSLTTAPELPATTLANWCYYGMFYSCTTLTTAPELPATTLASYCYNSMFYNCTSLNYIKCLATDIPATNCTNNWVSNVASTGTFIKDANMTGWTTGNNGIPTNWMVANFGLSLSISNVTTDLSGDTFNITVTSSRFPWTATTEYPWITLSQNTGDTGMTAITITVSSASTKRQGSVVFTDGQTSQTLTIQQADYIRQYLTFNVVSGGTIRWAASNASYTSILEYRKNSGSWYTITSTTAGATLAVNAGDKVEFRAQNYTYSDGSYFNSFCGTTAWFSLEGNVMSLIDGYKIESGIYSSGLHDYAFYRLFRYCTGLTSAENLILPVKTLSRSCYEHMFSHCYNLKVLPELPATTLANYCYRNMFSACSGLTYAPDLPLMTVTDGCYMSMFSECYSLATAPAILPATTLATECYKYMFHQCRPLTRAPELPATTLTTNAYWGMFSGCSNLNYIKCLATNISASNCTKDWVVGVQTASGTFVKNPGISISSWGRGGYGIPNNWTVQDAT